MKYVIGVDGGTESLRAGVFSASDGAMLGVASWPYETQYPHPGWAEQRPTDWWCALGHAVRGALAAAAVSPEHIAALCIDTTCCTVVALDEGGQPLRPALLWMDQRSGEQTKRVLATGDAVLQVNGAGAGPVSAEWMIPKSLWLHDHERATFDAATYICEYQDYINYHLTGRMCGSVNTMSVRWHYSAETGKPASLLSALGLGELLAKWPQDVLQLGDVVGGLTAAAAAHLGLLTGTPVAQGGADSFIGMVGLGVLQPGHLALLTGSSHLQLGMLDASLHGRGIFGTYAGAVLPGLHVLEGGQTSTGSAVAWLRRALVGQGVGYAELDVEAAAIAPGCEGLLCLDHFQGNRTPHTDPLSRGALVGLTLKHNRGHVFRALLEGVAFGTELVLEAMRVNGFHPESITIAGGATKSELWLQIHADVCNLPLLLTSNPEAPMLGCAILAAAAAGLHPGVLEAAAAMVTVERVVRPDPQAHLRYRPHYEAYKALYPALKASFHAAARNHPRGAEVFSEEAAPAVAAGILPKAGTSGAKAAATVAGLLQPQSAGQADAAAPALPSASSDDTARRLDAEGTSSAAPHAADGAVLNGRPAGIIAPSILAADFGDLAAEVRRVVAAGADWVHVDIMDATMCDNLTIGPPVVASLRRGNADVFLDCHLTVKDPRRYVAALAKAGASSITFHAEAQLAVAGAAAAGSLIDAAHCSTSTSDAASTVDAESWLAGAMDLAACIRRHGMRAAVALAPSTPAESVLPLLQAAAVDMVLCMTVAPGYGGQTMQPSVLDKVAWLRARFPRLDIQVDGGITPHNAAAAVRAGANVLVAGTAIFAAPGGAATAIAALSAALCQDAAC